MRLKINEVRYARGNSGSMLVYPLFRALRFAPRMPAAARNCYFET